MPVPLLRRGLDLARDHPVHRVGDARHQQTEHRRLAGLELLRRAIGPIVQRRDRRLDAHQRLGTHAIDAAVEHVGDRAHRNPGLARDVGDSAHRFCSTVERGKAAGGCAPALGCGSPSLREGFPAVLSLMARRETRFTPFGRCAQTVSASQMTKRAARAAMSLPLLGAAYVAADAHPPTALPNHRAVCRRAPRAMQRGGRYPGWAIYGAARSAAARSARAQRALQLLTRRDCLSAANAVSEASFSARPCCEHRSGVGAQRRPPHHEPAAGYRPPRRAYQSRTPVSPQEIVRNPRRQARDEDHQQQHQRLGEHEPPDVACSPRLAWPARCWW